MGFVLPRSSITPCNVAAHYDELDPFYRAVWGKHLHHGLWRSGRETPEEATRLLVDAVAALLALRPGDRVCDIGCGYGAAARQIAADWEVQVTGITISLAQARHAIAQGATVLVRDWLENDLPDAHFDAVYAIESSEHMPDLGRFLAEAHRVLRPGGRFVVCAWLAAEAPRRWQVRHLLEPICREGRLSRLGAASDYRHLLEAAGFRLIAVEDLSRSVARTWSICAWRVARLLATDAAARRYLLDRRQANRIFAVTVLRLLAAYRTGAMRYGLFAAERPG